MPDPQNDPQDKQDVDAEIENGGDGDGGNGNGGNGAPAAPRSMLRENVATIMAVAVIVALGIFYIYMLKNIDIKQLHWERGMTILSGVEAIVFGAAGFLFGTSIQRKVDTAQVESEKDKANRAESKLEETQETADQGKVLAGMVAAQAEAPGLPGGPSEYGALGGGGGGTRGTGLTSMQRQAQRIIDG